MTFDLSQGVVCKCGLSVLVQYQVRQDISRREESFVSLPISEVQGISSALVRAFSFVHGMVDGHSGNIVGVRDCIWVQKATEHWVGFCNAPLLGIISVSSEGTAPGVTQRLFT